METNLSEITRPYLSHLASDDHLKFGRSPKKGKAFWIISILLAKNNFLKVVGYLSPQKMRERVWHSDIAERRAWLACHNLCQIRYIRGFKTYWPFCLPYCHGWSFTRCWPVSLLDLLWWRVQRVPSSPHSCWLSSKKTSLDRESGREGWF